MTTKPPSDTVDCSTSDLDNAAVETLLSAASELAAPDGPLSDDDIDTECVEEIVDRMASALGGRFRHVDEPGAADVDDLVASASVSPVPSEAITPLIACQRIELERVSLALDEDTLAEAEPIVHAWRSADCDEIRLAFEASPEGRHSKAAVDLDVAGARRLAAQLLGSAACVNEDGSQGSHTEVER